MSEAETQTQDTSGAEAKKTARPKIDIQMTDGRTVSFPEGSKAQKEVIILKDGSHALRFDFAHGGTLTLRMSEIPEDTKTQAAEHGLLQKMGDSYASKKVSAEDAFLAVEKIWSALKEGNWSVRSSEVGESLAGVGVLTVAISRVLNVPVETAKETLKGLSTKEQKVLKLDPEISAMIQTIERERLQNSGGIDLEAVRAKLLAGTQG